MSQRKSLRKGKEARPISPGGDASFVAKPEIDNAGLDTSDLEDSGDVWTNELNDYIVETQKRQSQVAQYFWTSILVNSVRACQCPSQLTYI